MTIQRDAVTDGGPADNEDEIVLRPATTGLYRSQLPAALAEDDFTSRFVRIFEDIGEPLYDAPTSFSGVFDPQLASPEMARWLGGWIGVTVDEALSPERRRAVVTAAAAHFGDRGSAAALGAMLAAITGGPVEVSDPGGIARDTDPGPSGSTGAVRVGLTTTGAVDIDRIRQIIADEVPAWIPIEVSLADPQESAHA